MGSWANIRNSLRDLGSQQAIRISVIMRMSIQRDLADRRTNRNSALCRTPTSLIATEPQTRVTLPLRRSQFRWRMETLPGPAARHCAVFENLASSLHSVLEGAHAVNSTSH